MSTNFWKQNKKSSNDLSLHLSHPWFEFSLKVKVMGSNPGYFLKSFLLQPQYYIFQIFSSILDHCGNVPTHSTAHIFMTIRIRFCHFSVLGTFYGNFHCCLLITKKTPFHSLYYKEWPLQLIRKPRLSRDFRIFGICRSSPQTNFSDTIRNIQPAF